MSDRDNITLPREVVQEALEALELEATSPPLETTAAAMAALRTALAAEEPVAWLSRDEARLALWKAINSREFGNPTDDKLILDHLRQQGLWIGKVTSPALAAEQQKVVVTKKEITMPITDDSGKALRPQYRVVEQHGNWFLLYDQIDARHEFRIQKLRHDIALYPGISLAEAQKRFRELVEADNE